MLAAVTSGFFVTSILGRIPRVEKEIWEGNATSTKECIEKYRKTKYAKVIERIEGYYEAQEVPFGMVYKWFSECVVVECGCGARTYLTSSMTTCTGCDMDHAASVEEWLALERPEAADEDLRPWRYARDQEDIWLPY